jgi:hypothetical protein
MERRKLLTPEERQVLLGVPDDEESLIRHYTLSPQDRLQAEVRRRPHNQLGFAVQLCLMRYPGRALGVDECPPAALVAYVAQQTVCSLPVEVARPKLCDERGLRWMGRRRASRTGDEPCSRRAKCLSVWIPPN